MPEISQLQQFLENTGAVKYPIEFVTSQLFAMKKDAELSQLLLLADNMKALNNTDSELKIIEVQEKDLALKQIHMELSGEQSNGIEALFTAHQAQKNRNWLCNVPDLFLELIWEQACQFMDWLNLPSKRRVVWRQDDTVLTLIIEHYLPRNYLLTIT